MSPSKNFASPGVVLFTTPGCPQCPRVRNLSEQVALRMPDIEFTEVSAADQPDLAAAMKIRGAPTVVALHDGAEVDRIVGVVSDAEVERVFNAAAGAIDSSPPRVSAENRKVRTAAGAALIVAGLITQVVWLVLIGATITFAGWHDRVLPRRRAAA